MNEDEVWEDLQQSVQGTDTEMEGEVAEDVSGIEISDGVETVADTAATVATESENSINVSVISTSSVSCSCCQAEVIISEENLSKQEICCNDCVSSFYGSSIGSELHGSSENQPLDGDDIAAPSNEESIVSAAVVEVVEERNCKRTIFETEFCGCRDMSCSSKKHKLSVLESLWTCANPSCANRFDEACVGANGNLRGPQCCYDCSFEYCRCNNVECLSRRERISVASSTYECRNKKHGCKSRFKTELCIDSVQGCCRDCLFDGMVDHDKLMVKCSHHSENMGPVYSRIKVRVCEVLPSCSNQVGPALNGAMGWAYQLSTKQGYDVIFDDNPRPTRLAAYLGSYLSLITKAGSLMRLVETIDSGTRKPSANSAASAVGTNSSSNNLTYIWGKGNCDNFSAPWIKAVLHETPDGGHIVQYIEGDHEPEVLPPMEKDADRCLKQSIETGWYTYSLEPCDDQTGGDSVGLNVTAAGAGSDEIETDGDVGSGSDSCAAMTWAKGCYHMLGTCGKNETGLRVRLQGCGNNRANKIDATSHKEPGLAWALEQKNGTVTIKYDISNKTRFKPEKVDSLDQLRTFVSEGFYQLVEVLPLPVHQSHELALRLKSVLGNAFYERVITIQVGKRSQTYEVFSEALSNKASQSILFDTTGFPVVHDGFTPQYNLNKLILYHFKIHTGKLICHGKDFRGYCFPSLIKYNGDGTERNTAYAGQDLIGVCILETRCSEKRHDLVVYDMEKDECTRIAYDDHRSLVGCTPYLRTRFCDLDYHISDRQMEKVMRAFSVFVALGQWEFQPSRLEVNVMTKDPVAKIAADNERIRQAEGRRQKEADKQKAKDAKKAAAAAVSGSGYETTTTTGSSSSSVQDSDRGRGGRGGRAGAQRGGRGTAANSGRGSAQRGRGSGDSSGRGSADDSGRGSGGDNSGRGSAQRGGRGTAANSGRGSAQRGGRGAGRGAGRSNGRSSTPTSEITITSDEELVLAASGKRKVVAKMPPSRQQRQVAARREEELSDEEEEFSFDTPAFDTPVIDMQSSPILPARATRRTNNFPVPLAVNRTRPTVNSANNGVSEPTAAVAAAVAAANRIQQQQQQQQQHLLNELAAERAALTKLREEMDQMRAAAIAQQQPQRHHELPQAVQYQQQQRELPADAAGGYPPPPQLHQPEQQGHQPDIALEQQRHQPVNAVEQQRHQQPGIAFQQQCHQVPPGTPASTAYPLYHGYERSAGYVGAAPRLVHPGQYPQQHQYYPGIAAPGSYLHPHHQPPGYFHPPPYGHNMYQQQPMSPPDGVALQAFNNMTHINNSVFSNLMSSNTQVNQANNNLAAAQSVMESNLAMWNHLFRN